jgi:hypothetical protein
MTNAAMQAEKWYFDNADSLKRQFEKVGFRADRVDPIRGAISIELERPTLTATITVWNKGDISVLVLKEGSQDPFTIADRVLTPDENIPLLLDTYIREILAGGPPFP